MTQKKSVSTSLKSSRRSVRLWGAYGPRARLPDADDQGRPAGQNDLPAPAQAPLSLRVRQALLREEHLSRPLSARHQTGHRRRALRSVVLPDHGRVDDGIDRRDHGAAKRSRQVFEVHWFDPAVQKIHIAHLLFCAKKSRTGNRRLSLPLVRLLFLRTARPPSRGCSIIPAHPRRIVKHGFPAAGHQDLRR